MGYDLVRVLVQGKVRRTLQIMAERHDRLAMSVADCVFLSRTLSAILDTSILFGRPYILEISSPGLDRPLTHVEDFTRFVGYEVFLELLHPIEKRRRFHGKLVGVDKENLIHLSLPDGKAVSVPQAEIVKAKLAIQKKEELSKFLKKRIK